jgi:hypothetical protein
MNSKETERIRAKNRSNLLFEFEYGAERQRIDGIFYIISFGLIPVCALAGGLLGNFLVSDDNTFRALILSELKCLGGLFGCALYFFSQIFELNLSGYVLLWRKGIRVGYKTETEIISLLENHELESRQLLRPAIGTLPRDEAELMRAASRKD